MRNGGIDHREQTLLADRHFIQNLLRNVNQLKHLMLTKDGLNDLPAHLDVLKHLLAARLDVLNEFVDILIEGFFVDLKQLLQRVSVRVSVGSFLRLHGD